MILGRADKQTIKPSSIISAGYPKEATCGGVVRSTHACTGGCHTTQFRSITGSSFVLYNIEPIFFWELVNTGTLLT